MSKFDRNEYKKTHYIEPRKPFIIDQIGLEVPVEYLRIENKEFYQEKRPDMSIHEASGRKYIHFHDECFKAQDYNYPILQNIYDAIMLNLYDQNPIFRRKFEYDEILSKFKLRVFEMAFDTYDDVFPYEIDYRSGCYIKTNHIPPTIYTSDFRQVASTRPYTQDSLISIYDRGNKIGSKESITRFEFRLKEKYIRDLSMQDLKLTPIGFSARVKPLLIKYMQKIIHPYSIKAVNSKLLHMVHPFLYSILKESYKFHDLTAVNHEMPTLYLPPCCV